MKLLYIHQYFLTPAEPGPTRSYWLAQHTVLSGHQVTVITGRGSQARRVIRESIDGIEVVYIRNPYDQRMGYARRLYSFIRFMFLSAWVAMNEKKVDLVFATSTPLSVGITALMLKWFAGKRYIFEVRDLWPEAPVQLGIIRNKLLIFVLRKLEKLIYDSATHILALSPGMKEGVVRTGVKEEKVSIIPNMSKNDVFYSRSKDTQVARRFSIKLGHFNAVYLGALGVSNGLDYIIDAAVQMKREAIHDIDILFVGTGKREDELKQKCAGLRLDFAKFLGAHPLTTLSGIVNLCDCSLVIFADIPILYTNSPNKLFDSLSAGKPVILNSNGWTREMVEEHNCGMYVDPKDPSDLVRALVRLRNDRDLLHRMSQSARALAENVYDKSILLPQFVALIEKYAV